MNDSSIIKKRIMRRVYMIWVARKVANPLSLKLAGLLVTLLWLRQYVSIKHVLYNSPSFTNPLETLGFFSNAFLSTTFVVEVLVVAVLALGFFLLRDAVRRFRLASEYQALSGMLG